MESPVGTTITYTTPAKSRDTGVTERIDQTESLRINGIEDLDFSMRNYSIIYEKVGRPPNKMLTTVLRIFS
jgi:hypothetical protein